MDFEGKPIADKTGQMQKVLNAVNKPGVVRAQTKNKQVARAMKARVLQKVGKVSGLPMIGGAIAAGGALLAGAGPSEAAGAFVDAENPLDNGSLANGERTANMNPQPVPSKPLGSVLFDQFRRGIDWYRNNMNAF